MPNYRQPDPAAATNAFARQVQMGANMRAADQSEQMNAFALAQAQREDDAARKPKYDAGAFQKVGAITAQISTIADPVQKRQAFRAAIQGNAPLFETLGIPVSEQIAKLDTIDDGQLDQALSGFSQFAPKAAPQDLAPGHSLVRGDGKGGFEAAYTAPTAPGDEASPFAKINPSDYTPASVAKYKVSKNEGDLVARSPSTAPNPNDLFNHANALRDEYEKKTGNYGELLNSFETIKTLGTNASPAGDIAMVAAFMRAVDPGSRVTGAEQATAENSGGVPAVIRSYYNQLLGKGQLSESQRADFMTQAENLVTGRERGYKAARSKYEGLSKRAGVNPVDVIGDEVTISGTTRKAPPGATPVPTATGPQGEKLYLRNGQWVPQ